MNSYTLSIKRLAHRGYYAGVVVQGKCQGLVFSDFVSSVMDIPLRVPPLAQVVVGDYHYHFLRPVSPNSHRAGA